MPITPRQRDEIRDALTDAFADGPTENPFYRLAIYCQDWMRRTDGDPAAEGAKAAAVTLLVGLLRPLVREAGEGETKRKRRPMSDMFCGDCDGVGWVEGGATLKTTCAKCKGTGIIKRSKEFSTASS